MSRSPPKVDPDDPLQSVKDVVGDSSLLIAVVGAVVSLVVAFIPGSPFVGGALAGYLVRHDRGRGAWVGALSGVFVAIPTGLFVLFAFGFSAFLATFGLAEALFGVVVAVFGLMALFYTVGLAAIGGYLGVVAYEHRQQNAGGRRENAHGHRENAHGDRDSVAEDARAGDRY